MQCCWRTQHHPPAVAGGNGGGGGQLAASLEFMARCWYRCVDAHFAYRPAWLPQPAKRAPSRHYRFATAASRFE